LFHFNATPVLSGIPASFYKQQAQHPRVSGKVYKNKELVQRACDKEENGLPNQNTVTEPSNKNQFKPLSKKVQKR
jgi:hypothetical protein